MTYEGDPMRKSLPGIDTEMPQFSASKSPLMVTESMAECPRVPRDPGE
jgi:hypothetical protein